MVEQGGDIMLIELKGNEKVCFYRSCFEWIHEGSVTNGSVICCDEKDTNEINETSERRNDAIFKE